MYAKHLLSYLNQHIRILSCGLEWTNLVLVEPSLWKVIQKKLCSFETEIRFSYTITCLSYIRFCYKKKKKIIFGFKIRLWYRNTCLMSNTTNKKIHIFSICLKLIRLELNYFCFCIGYVITGYVLRYELYTFLGLWWYRIKWNQSKRYSNMQWSLLINKKIHLYTF